MYIFELKQGRVTRLCYHIGCICGSWFASLQQESTCHRNISKHMNPESTWAHLDLGDCWLQQKQQPLNMPNFPHIYP